MSTSKTRVRQGWLGELEHMLLLSIVRLGPRAYAPEVGDLLEQRAGRRLSRGALYSTLDRLESKGYVSWSVEPGTEARAGSRRRLFEVTAVGMTALRASHQAIRRLGEGLGKKLAATD